MFQVMKFKVFYTRFNNGRQVTFLNITKRLPLVMDREIYTLQKDG